MAVTTDKPAPYATSSSIIDLIGRHRSRGLPAPVTAEVLIAHRTGSELKPSKVNLNATIQGAKENGAPVDAQLLTLHAITASDAGSLSAPTRQTTVATLYARNNDVVYNVTPISQLVA
jgi:hypothetical protein